MTARRENARVGGTGPRLVSEAVFRWPPCECGHPKCPDAEDSGVEPVPEPARSQSPTMARVRPLVDEANQRAGGRR